MPYKKANIFLALLYMIFSKQKYADLAMDHTMWIALKDEDLKCEYEKGTYPQEGWRENQAPKVLEELALLKHAFWKSFLITILTASVVIGFGFYHGTLDLDLRINIVKTMSFVGASVAAWGAVFQLICPDIETYNKQSLNEVIQKSAFFTLFLLGVLISLFSLVL